MELKMGTFQPWFVDIVSVISDIVVGLSAIAVAIIAGIGIYQWKRELTGRTKFEIAKRMAALIIEYRDRYKRARNFRTFPGESAGRIRSENETLAETELLNEYHAREKRLEPLQETLRKLYETSWEAEVMIDAEVGELIKPLEATFAELFASTETYFKAMYKKLNRPVGVDVNDDWLDIHHRRIYGLPDDDISDSIDKVTRKIGDSLKSYLK
jgi:hypothetical protein